MVVIGLNGSKMTDYLSNANHLLIVNNLLFNMSKLNILLLSDIHFKNTNPENEGKVLSAFFKDLDKTMDKNERDFNYCIISGDLVQAGNSDVTYNNFYDVVVKKILPFVPLDHFMITPGNHDLSQDTVKYNYEDHQKEIGGHYDESAFMKLQKTASC